jgi:hypothetical protein
MEAIYKFMEDNLHNVTARVSSGGLFVSGHMEGDCKLQVVHRFQGIYLFSELQWNDTKVDQLVWEALMADKGELNYKHTDHVHEIMTPIIQDAWIRVGQISPYGIKKIDCTYREQNRKDSQFKDRVADSVTIIYEKGAIIEIRNIKPIKTT